MGEIRRTTLRLPRWLHMAIKREAVITEQDMTDIVVAQLAARYPDQSALFFNQSSEVKLHISEETQPTTDFQPA